MKSTSIRMTVLSAMLALFVAISLPSSASDKAPMKNGPIMDHDEMIEAYRKNPTPFPSRTPGGVRTIGHCEFLAKSNREMAKPVREMAAAHEEMAKETAK